jgi:hypothetical protein
MSFLYLRHFENSKRMIFEKNLKTKNRISGPQMILSENIVNYKV